MARHCAHCNAKKPPKALTNGSNTPVPTSAIFYIPISILIEAPVLAQTSAPAQAHALISNPLSRYTDKKLQKTTILALELFVKGEEHGQINSAPHKWLLKTWFLNLNYKNSHLDCYYFC